jgi:hypothetical protein
MMPHELLHDALQDEEAKAVVIKINPDHENDNGDTDEPMSMSHQMTMTTPSRMKTHICRGTWTAAYHVSAIRG